jgi:hypothetical protein
LIVIPRDDEFAAKEHRARSIIRLASKRVVATAGSRHPRNPGSFSAANYTCGAGDPRPRQDWLADVKNAMTRGAGTRGARVLIAVMLHGHRRSGHTMRAVAVRLGIAESDASFMYCDALHGFLFWMDRLGVPDDYRPEPELPVVVIR